MKRIILPLAIAILVSSAVAFGAPSTNGIAGDWQGTLDAGTARLRVLFRISQGSGGVLTAKMVSLDQGAREIPVDSVAVKDGAVRLELKAVQGVYEGALDKTGTKISGRWQQGPQTLPLTLERSPSAVPGEDAASTAFGGAGQLAKGFVSLLAQQDFQKAAAGFDETMKAAVSADQLKTIWTGQLKTLGAYQRIEATRTESLQQYRIVFVTCRFQNQRADVKVVIDKTDKIAGLFFVSGEADEYRPPAYAKPASFKEKETVIGTGEWQLPGTLSMPAGKGPFRAVILVHGSGPNDRDESIRANKPFRDLAWGLASQGIAVLRYEKRTRQYAAQIAASLDRFTVNDETIIDALQGVSLLRTTEGIDTNKIFVLGHSLGGTLAPRIGASDSNIAGLIIMAGAARPLEDVVLEQTLYQASLEGELSADDRSKLEDVKRQVAAIKSLSKGSSFRGQLLFAPASYWLDLQGYNPPAIASTLRQPMLILQGAEDCQVNPKADFEEWEKALSGRKDVKLRKYPALNHLFIEVEGRSTGAEYGQPGHVAEAVVRDIAAFIKLH